MVCTMTSIWINGRLIPEHQAKIPVSDSAYLYGHGAFETLRAVDGEILFLEKHLQRLRRGSRLLKIRFPYRFGGLTKEINRLLKKNHLDDATVRMMLSQDTDGQPRLVITAKPYKPFPDSYYSKGAPMILVKTIRNDSARIANTKTTNYLTKMLARREIERAGAVEGVLLNNQGRVTEGASSNLFVVKKGRLITPPISDGLLPGVRRAVVLRLARILKIPCREKSLAVRNLKDADEIFLTSSLKGIMPIRTFDGKKVGKICPGPITRRLTERYLVPFGLKPSGG